MLSVLFAFILLFFFFFAVEIDSKLTLHHMGKVLSFNLPSQNLKSGGLHF